MTRMSKKYATIYIEEEVIRKAKEIGLNISKTCENALKEATRRLETPKIQYLTQNNSEKGGTGTVGSCMVDRTGLAQNFIPFGFTLY